MSHTHGTGVQVNLIITRGYSFRRRDTEKKNEIKYCMIYGEREWKKEEDVKWKLAVQRNIKWNNNDHEALRVSECAILWCVLRCVVYCGGSTVCCIWTLRHDEQMNFVLFIWKNSILSTVDTACHSIFISLIYRLLIKFKSKSHSNFNQFQWILIVCGWMFKKWWKIHFSYFFFPLFWISSNAVFYPKDPLFRNFGQLLRHF